MEKKELLYEGKAKRVYRTDDDQAVWIEYKNSATAFNGVKKAEIAGKARLNNEIASLLFSKLAEKGIESHFICKISETEQVVKKVDIIPLEVIVRNIAAGSFSQRLGVEEGRLLKRPLIEFCLKDDKLGDPLITDDHVDILGIASMEDITQLKEQALKVNKALSQIFAEIAIRLVDFKLEFGRSADGRILLADEVSPDTCRLWDMNTNIKLDKDVFRRDLGDLAEAYENILERLGGTAHV